MATMITSQQYLLREEDYHHEETVLQNPYNLNHWWRYLIANIDSPFDRRAILYERALKSIPASFKLWHAYLSERIHLAKDLPVTHPSYRSLNNTFERALVTMHTMPCIWIMYLKSLTHQKLITRTRRVFDRALSALPVSQHERIWKHYLVFAQQDGVPVETALKVYRRYLKFDPSYVEDFIEFLIGAEMWQEAAERLAGLVNDDEFCSVKGKTKHVMWMELSDLLVQHSEEISGLDVEGIVRGGIRKYTDEVAVLWTSLANYYIRRGLPEKARDVFEEGMTKVATFRDFSVIFDGYTMFEESMLSEKIKMDEMKCFDEDNADDKLDDKDLDLRLARLDNLLDRRSELANSVLLRQNPHDVNRWHKRVKLFEGNAVKQITTYAEALRTVEPMKAVGKPHTLWLALAKLYEDHGCLADARMIFDKAVQVDYKEVDDLASLWCEWAEMEGRQNNFEEALSLISRATAEPSVEVSRRVAAGGNEPVQMKLHTCLRLWTLFVNLVESKGNLESTRQVYERILDLRIGTPQVIMNYAQLLEKNKYFEDSFKVYERGIGIFIYPHVKDIWDTYLSKFIDRYGGSKLERARELFERAIAMAPAEAVKPLYLKYAKLEENFGLASRAMRIYDQATKAVPPSEKLEVYEIYAARSGKTRKIYEQAIESGLPDKDVKTVCIKLAVFEKSLGEIDRARALYKHASQLGDPRSDPELWTKWQEFEVQHGNEDTFRELLRVKRSVSAVHSQLLFSLPENMMQSNQMENNGQDSLDTETIDLPADNESEDDEKVEIAEKGVPGEVFGGLYHKGKEGRSEKGDCKRGIEDNDHHGALERIKRMRTDA